MYLEEKVIKGEDYSEKNLSQWEILDVTFKECNFTGANLRDANLEDVSFQGCNLSLVKLNGAKLKDVKFKECRIQGVDFSNVSDLFFDCSFEDTEFRYCYFFDKNLTGIKFSNVNMVESSFQNCNLSKIKLKEVTLTGTSFMRCNLKKTKFEDCNDISIDIRDNNVEGMEIPEIEGKNLLALLGIKTK